MTLTFGERLMIERKRKGLTKQELSEICGIYKSAISRYESGETEPLLFSAMCIADALGVSIDYLVGREKK